MADCHSDLDMARGNRVHYRRAHSIVLTAATTASEKNPGPRQSGAEKWTCDPGGVSPGGGDPVRRDLYRAMRGTTVTPRPEPPARVFGIAIGGTAVFVCAAADLGSIESPCVRVRSFGTRPNR